jgi:archaemetzincin
MEDVLIVPVGAIERQIMFAVARALENAFHCSVKAGKGVPVPADAYNARREQYLASGILDHLRKCIPGQVSRLLGVTDADLYVPRLNFVFGLADEAGGDAVVSIARLREEFYGRYPERSLFLLRACKEAVHEIGHTFGLGHCSDFRCVMFFSNSLEDTDRKGPELCGKCRKKLGM